MPGPTRFCGDDVALLVLETPFGVGEATRGRPFVVGAAFLRATGCDHGQGYLLGRPMSPEAVAALVSR